MQTGTGWYGGGVQISRPAGQIGVLQSGCFGKHTGGTIPHSAGNGGLTQTGSPHLDDLVDMLQDGELGFIQNGFFISSHRFLHGGAGISQTGLGWMTACLHLAFLQISQLAFLLYCKIPSGFPDNALFTESSRLVQSGIHTRLQHLGIGAQGFVDTGGQYGAGGDKPS